MSGYAEEKFENRGAGKTLNGLLDALPTERDWEEDEMDEWLALFDDAARRYYHLPRRTERDSGATRSSSEAGT